MQSPLSRAGERSGVSIGLIYASIPGIMQDYYY